MNAVEAILKPHDLKEIDQLRIVNHLATDGVLNWLEGHLLIALFLPIATAFFFA